jgi:nitroreductase
MFDILQKRRSIRKFRDSEIETSKIESLKKALLLCPSSRSLKPLEFIFVTNKSTLKDLAQAKPHGSLFVKNAPLAIVVLADPVICDVWIEDASIASIVVQLEAESIGLSSCWIQIRERMYDASTSSGEYVRKVLDIPESYTVLSIIGVGYADEPKPPTVLDSLDYSKIHEEKFGHR